MYNTYQSYEYIAFRKVVRNLTLTFEIGISIEEIGFSLRHVTNILKNITKNNFPIFFCRS